MGTRFLSNKFYFFKLEIRSISTEKKQTNNECELKKALEIYMI